MAEFIGYPSGKVLAVFGSEAEAGAAMEAVREAGAPEIERFHGPSDADRFDGTGQRHGPIARAFRTVQFSLMDQLPAMAWYEAALREGKTIISVKTRNRPSTLRVVEVLKAAGGHFINHFGRAATEEFARWQGPEPNVSDVMRH
jgi:hypothetical protein